jgi:hypothetical protein
MRSSDFDVDGGRRCMGTRVSMELTTDTFGFDSSHSTTERVSGSLSGYSPGTGLRPAAARRIAAGHRPPVLRVVAVQVEAANAILVVAAVAIVVDALGHGAPDRRLARPRRPHEPAAGVALVQHHVRRDRVHARHARLPAHGVDDAVAVDVVVLVLVEEAIAIVVHRPHAAAVHHRSVQVEVRAVRVVLRPERDRLRVQQPRDARIAAVVLQEVLRQPHDRLRRRDLAAVPAALEERRRLVLLPARLPVRQRHLQDRPVLVAAADLVQLDEVRVLLRPAVQPRVHHVHRVVAVERQHSRRPRTRPARGGPA